MSINKILVALNRRPEDNIVFDYALNLAQSFGSDSFGREMKLVHCLGLDIHKNLGSMIDAGVGLRTQSDALRAEEADRLEQIRIATTWLSSLQKQAQEKGIQTEVVCELSEPGPYICQLAQTWPADKIIVGNSGKKGLKRLLLGSVSHHIIQHAPCPTIVVPWNGNEPVEY